jgi:hypothetical protein
MAAAASELFALDPGAPVMTGVGEPGFLVPHPGTDLMIHTQKSTLSAQALAERAERIDTDSWFGQWSAAPAPVVKVLQLAAAQHGERRMLRSVVPFSHFNMVLTLGCPAPADEAAFAAIDAFYGHRPGVPHWILLNDHAVPSDLPQALRERGYEPAGQWERVVLQQAAPERWAPHASGCEPETRQNASEWARFILACYGMPPIIGEWLSALVDRPGWIHAVRREDGRTDVPVVMARSLFHDAEGWAWLGIDAPVPGLMAPCFEDDQRLVAALLTAAASRGARHFVSDIEQPSPGRASEAYRRWGELGFEPAYLRSLFAQARRS